MSHNGCITRHAGGTGHCGGSAKLTPGSPTFSEADYNASLAVRNRNVSWCGHHGQCMAHCIACCPDPETLRTCYEHCGLCHLEASRIRLIKRAML